MREVFAAAPNRAGDAGYDHVRYGNAPAAEHFLKADRLGRKLAVSVQLLALGTVLEFHRVHPSIRMKFDQIGFANQVQPLAPHGQRTFHTHARLDFLARRINQTMHGLATCRVDVVREGLLQMNQPALARAVRPMLQGGECNGISLAHTGGGTIIIQRICLWRTSWRQF